MKIYQEIQNNPDSLILGVRDFNSPIVPFKSKFGNKLTKSVLKLLIGGNITDTQTGLRGIPNKLLGKWSVLFGERFEYETMMLIDSIKSDIPVREVRIKTIYIDDNRETHFNAVTDSIAIYKLIFRTFFKYIMVSLSSFIIDYALFCFLIGMLPYTYDKQKIAAATVISRICSSLFNYAANKNIVFKNNGNHKAIVYYYILCITQMFSSALLVLILNSFGILPVQLSKIVVDVFLFLMSFQIQQKIIFRKGAAI